MQVRDVLRYFTPDNVQSVAQITMTSFRNVSTIHLSVAVVMWKILITTFLRCQFYHAQGEELIHEISQLTQVTLQILLFGNPLQSLHTNTLIFEAVHKYITDTKRF